jgi:hypothetical protein
MEALVRSVIPIIGCTLGLLSCGPTHRDGMMVKVDGGDSVFLEGLHPGVVLGNPDSAAWRAIPPLDTNALMRTMHLKESASVLDPTVPADTDWYAEEDTIIVRYVAYACTCPDHDLVDTTRFSGIKGFYVEPADGSITIPLRMQVSGNMFELIGRRSRGLYTASEAMGPPMPGYGFRFRSYRIKHPYEVLGPDVLAPSLNALDSLQLWGPALRFKVE